MIAALTIALLLSHLEPTTGPISHDGLRMDAQPTQADLIVIAERIGWHVTSENPTRLVTDAEAGTFVDVFKWPPTRKPPWKGHKHRRHHSKCDPDD